MLLLLMLIVSPRRLRMMDTRVLQAHKCDISERAPLKTAVLQDSNFVASWQNISLAIHPTPPEVR